MADSNLKRVLARPVVRRITGAGLVSALGDWLNFGTVITLVAFRLHGGAGDLAAVTIAMALPIMLVSIPAGVLADRCEPRKVLVTCDLARAATVVGMILVHGIVPLIVLVAVRSAFGAAFTPAQQVLLVSDVEEEDQLAVSSVNQMGIQIAKIIGPAAAGFTLSRFGPDPAFWADVASFLLSAVLLLGLRPQVATTPTGQSIGEGQSVGEGPPADGSAPAGDGPPSGGAQLGAGLRFVARSRALSFAIAVLTATVFIVLLFDTLSPLALRRLGFGPSLYGLLVGAVGLGATAAAVLLGESGNRWRPFSVMGAGTIAAGALVGVLGVAVVEVAMVPQATWLVVALLMGAASTAIITPFSVVIQRATPPELLGRVLAVAETLPTVAQVAGPALAAVLAGIVGVGPVLLGAGVGLAVLGLVVLLTGPSLPTTSTTPSTEGDPAEPIASPSDVSRFDIDLQALTPATRRVLAELSEEEGRVLAEVQRALGRLEAEVVAHESGVAGGLLF